LSGRVPTSLDSLKRSFGLGSWAPPPLQIGQAGLRHFVRAFVIGYVEGENIIIEFRWAEGRYDRLSALADELVRLKINVLVTTPHRGGLAAKCAGATIPVVMAVTGDAIGTGVVPSPV
jgi:hypothetical protein